MRASLPCWRDCWPRIPRPLSPLNGNLQALCLLVILEVQTSLSLPRGLPLCDCALPQGEGVCGRTGASGLLSGAQDDCLTGRRRAVDSSPWGCDQGGRVTAQEQEGTTVVCGDTFKGRPVSVIRGFLQPRSAAPCWGPDDDHREPAGRHSTTQRTGGPTVSPCPSCSEQSAPRGAP